MHPEATVASVLKLHEAGLNNCEISRRTGVPRPTIRDWSKGKLPHSYAHRHHEHLLFRLRLPWAAVDGGLSEVRDGGGRDLRFRKADVARLDEFIGPKR